MAIDDDKLYGLKGSQVKDLANKVKDKQDALVAGDGIAIASDGKTISTTGAQTMFYANNSETGTTRHIYKNADMTGAVSAQDILDANEKGQVVLRMSTTIDPSSYNDAYLQNTYVSTNPYDYQFLFLDNRYYYEYDANMSYTTAFEYSRSEIQFKITIAQTTGASTTDVMSQDGVSKLLFGKYNNNYDKEKIQIGQNASATAGNTTAIGNTAVSTYGSGIAIGYEARDAQSSVGLGAFSQPSSRGEVNIGIPRATSTQWDAYGHNNTPYRLLTGVSDPESAHDAATKGYVDTVTPTFTMTTTDPGEGAPLSAGQFLAVYSAS